MNALAYLRYGFRFIAGLDHPKREMEVRDDDIFLVSYPKSGNTWMRFLVANLLYPEKQIDFRNIDSLIPGMNAATTRQLRRLPRPRIIKTHLDFDPRFKNVIYVVRDPRDVAVSQYHFNRKRGTIPGDYPLDDFVVRFVENRLWHPNGSWADNVQSWIYTPIPARRFLLVHYEALQCAPLTELARVAEFLGIKANAVALQHALEQSDAERLRKLETQQAERWNSTKDTRKDIPFVRAAKSGQWQDVLSESSVLLIEQKWGKLMARLGYGVGSRTIAPVCD